MIEIFKRVEPTPEIWKPVNSVYPNISARYQVSTFGRVLDSFTNTFMTQSPMYSHPNAPDYYLTVSLLTINNTLQKFLVHRLVLSVFNPIPDFQNTIVNHINGNKSCNWLWNLEWSNYSDNLSHAYANGLRPKGEDHNFAVISLEQAKIICQGLEKRLSYEEIAANAGLEYNDKTKGIIYQIRVGNNWKWLSALYNIPDARSNLQRFTTEQVKFICESIVKGVRTRDILTSLGYDLSQYDKKQLKLLFETVGKIRRRQRYTNISKDYDF